MARPTPKHSILISKPAKLTLNEGILCYRQARRKIEIPLQNIASITLENPEITVTGGLLSSLVEKNIIVITCNARQKPNGILHAITHNSRQNSVAQVQIKASIPVIRKIWMRFVQQRITNQAAVLSWRQHRRAARMQRIASELKIDEVKVSNAVAERLYFAAAFPNFKRYDKNKTNAALSYGYTLVQSVIVGELHAHGLLPDFGVHDSREFNSNLLADEILEIFRPFLDSWVIENTCFDADDSTEISLSDRERLTQVLHLRVRVGDKETSYMPQSEPL